MKRYRDILGLVTPTLFVAGYLVISATPGAAATADSARITGLFGDAKTQAVELTMDATDMESFTRSSQMTWAAYANKVTQIREHVNNIGKLVADMQDARGGGSPWQQTAIDRIMPLLKEVAANTQATIEHLNDNKTRVHFPAFQNYVKANYELSSDLEKLIRDFVNYGETQERFAELSKKLEID